MNVDYDVAPQRQFRAAPHQAYEMFGWVLQNGDRYEWSAARVGVGTQSVGGTMAEGIVRLALKAGGPTPEALVTLDRIVAHLEGTISRPENRSSAS